MKSFQRVLRTICLGSVAMIALGAYPAAAQSDGTALNNRLLRLENEFRTLSQQVYRGQMPPGGPVGGGAPAAFAGNFEVRLSQLETELRGLTGRIEEVQFGQRKLQDDMKKLSEDMEFRLSQLEQRAATAGTAAASPTVPQPATPAPQATEAAPQATATPSNTMGTVPVPNATGTESAMVQPKSSGNAQEDYDKAYNLLRQADYAGAEAALKAFVKQYPGHKLTGNAQYWLAETYYVRGKYEDAALAFGEGFEKYPDSAKAADNLLKLGLSLVQLNRTDDACRALGLVEPTFPNSSAAVRQRAQQELAKLKCS